MKPLTQILVTVGLLCGVLLVFGLYSVWPSLTGTDVVLKTLPVDPFDPLRGQFLIIRYEAATVPAIDGTGLGDTVYVALQEKDGIWEAAGAYTKPPVGLYIRGRVVDLNEEEIYLSLGIENYFFEQGAEFNTTNLTVRVRVASDGRSSIKELLHDGKPLEIKYQK